MAHGRANHYRFIGESGSAEGPTLEDAIRELVDWWTRMPSLVVHEMGNLIVRIEGEDTEISFEVTNPKLLEDIRYDSPSAMIDHLAEVMGLTAEQVRSLVDQADHVTVEVNTIRAPSNVENWEPDPELDAKKSLERGIPFLMSSLAKDPDHGGLKQAVEIGQTLKMSKKDIISHTGATPKEVDEFFKKGVGGAGGEPKKKRNYKDQMKEIKQELKKKQSLKEAAKALKIPESTLRGIRDRFELSAVFVEAKSHSKGDAWSKEAKRDFVRIAKKLGVAKAAKKAGVPIGTARKWTKN
jgi:hypothetical protein